MLGQRPAAARWGWLVCLCQAACTQARNRLHALCHKPFLAGGLPCQADSGNKRESWVHIGMLPWPAFVAHTTTPQQAHLRPAAALATRPILCVGRVQVGSV